METTSPSTEPTLLERANAALIRYPRFKELHRDIQQCQRLSTLAGEPQCMSLEGITGAGKSTLVREYARVFPRFETENGTCIPVFCMETPSPVTVKGMAAVMLEQLGDPAAHHGTLWSMNSRLVRLIRACGVELVILDDFHHLIDHDTNRILLTVSDWLKVLIKETGVPFLVVGIEGKVEQILKANAQLSRLFAVRETLHPFAWNDTDPATIQTFATFMQCVERAIGMPLTSDIARVDLLVRLQYATHGIVANIMNLLRAAQVLAVEEQQPVVQLSHLARAFDKRLACHLAGTRNPFTTTDPVVLVAEAPTDAHQATSSHARRRQDGRGPRVSDTLRT